MKKHNHYPDIDFENLVENLYECVWLFDLNNRCFRYISPSVFVQRGFTVAEAMTQSLEEIFTTTSLQKIKNDNLRRYHAFLSGDRRPEIVFGLDEYEQYCKDGSIITVDISTRLTLDEENNGIIVIGITRDASAHRHCETHLLAVIHSLQEQVKDLQKSPLTQPTLIVQFFGKFMATHRGTVLPIKWRTSKTEELLAFLLSQDRSCLSRHQLIDTLWPETCGDKAAKYLHTTLYNLKKDLKAVEVVFDWELINGFYCFSLVDHFSDLKEFKRMLNVEVTPQNVKKIIQALEALDVVEAFTPKVIRKIEAGIRIYRGDFLGENAYPWAASQSADYRQLFEKTLFVLSRYYFLTHDYPSTKRILSRLLELDNLNETYHELLLNVYFFDQDYPGFIKHYQELRALLLAELGQLPCPCIQSLFDQYQGYVENQHIIKRAHF